ncbi:MAG TPA: FAD-dependent oxidoreductase [Acidobacteriaceae bacterium]
MRELHTARLEQKLLLSAAAQCYHFEFTATTGLPLAYEPGQFLSFVADDPQGKSYTRAYSLASAPRGPRFEVCANRVPGGFLSNLLCDLAPGDTLHWHGPHGLFTLRQPLPGPAAASLMIAAGTGIAPLRSFLQSLFPALERPHPIHLIYESPSPEELFYDSDFRHLSATQPLFHYHPVPGSDQDRAQTLATLTSLASAPAPDQQATPQAAGQAAPSRNEAPSAAPAPTQFSRYAYICGLSQLVKDARAHLLDLGWHRRQILSERYD